MKADSIASAIAGIFFGIILGWIIGTQQAARSRAEAPPQAAAPQAAAPTAGNTRQPPALDQERVDSLTGVLTKDPKNATAAIQLANAYFDAEQYPQAIKWYEQALQVDPKNADASTDLGVSYYYVNRTDEALRQFDRSLAIDPGHTKTLLNQGIVLAFGKNDLKAAEASWKRVVELAPNSPEAQAAQRGLEGIAAGRQAATPAPGGE